MSRNIDHYRFDSSSFSAHEKHRRFFRLLFQDGRRINNIVSRLILHEAGYEHSVFDNIYRKTIAYALSRFHPMKSPDFLHWMLDIAKRQLALHEKMFSREDVNITFLSDLFENDLSGNRPLNESDQKIARELFDAIPSYCRDYFLFHDIIGMNYSEIADHFGVDEKAARRKVCQAKVMLTAISRRYVVDSLTSDDDEAHYVELSRRIHERLLDTADDVADEPSTNPIDPTT